MDRAIVERAVRALAALNTGRDFDPRTTPAPGHAPSTQTEDPKCGEIATWGSPHCAGCYEVSPGVRIHPPKCGKEYRAWLERWEAKGKVQ